jgi:ABC-type transport system substrate-binding protein
MDGPATMNPTGYCNPEMMQLWDEIVTMQDSSAVAENWAEIQRMHAEDVPLLYGCTRVTWWPISKRVQGRLEPSIVYWQGNHWQLEKLWLDDAWGEK